MMKMEKFFVLTVLSEKRIIKEHYTRKREYAMPHISGVYYFDDGKHLVGQFSDKKGD